MSSFGSFERLIVRNEVGYVCDETSLARLSSQGSFDGAVIKLVTKCETSMVLLSGHNEVDRFTVDVVVIDNQQKRGSDDVIAGAWPKCEVKGYHGLMALAKVDGSCMPDNGCRETYSLAQFVNYLIHGVESYFMFQKPSPFFTLNAIDLWQAFEELAMESCYIVMAWKYKEDPRRETPLRSPLIQLNTSTTTMRSDKVKQQSASQTPVTSVQVKKKQKRVSLQPQNQVRESGIASKRGRLSIQPQVTSDSSEEEDDEIFIKKRLDPVSVNRAMTSKKESLLAEAGTTKAQSEDKVGDIIFGFERSQPKTPGRKSTTRKSMMQDWSEDHKHEILWFFDNLNPKESEQTCIALTCKFASMKFTQELSSKLLYQWIQKKGRTIQKTVDCYDLPETDSKKLMIDFFKSLNSELSETSRVAFTCKYMHSQFGVDIQSKQFYSMLNDKGKKSRKR